MDLSHLNPRQAEAVQTTEGPLLVLAGAGSGKTRVITHRIQFLISARRVPPRSILAVTFTNKAAAEMRERVGLLIKGAGLKGRVSDLTITTFHAFGVEVLRRDGKALNLLPGFAIADMGDQLAIVKRAMLEVRVDDRSFDARKILAIVSRAKNLGKAPEPLPEGLGDDYDLIAAEVFPRYQRSLRAQGMVDFDDLISLPGQLFTEHPQVLERYLDRYRYLLVDEYQDTSKSQLDLLRHLAGQRKNVCVVGDDDQSIYGWRGAEASNILRFNEMFGAAREVFLEQNYRSAGCILQAANRVIAQNPNRRPKRLWTDRGDGPKVKVVACPDDEEEARYIGVQILEALKAGRPPAEIAVLYRTSAQSQPMEENLRANGIPYAVSGGQDLFDRREVRDVVAYLKACLNLADEVSLLRVINVPPRGIGEVTVERILGHARASGISLWEALRRAPEWDDLPSGSAERVLGFCDLIERHRVVCVSASPAGVAAKLVEEVGLRAEIRRLTPSLEAADRKVAALDRLVDSVDQRSRLGKADLAGYLRMLTLDSSDSRDEEEQGPGRQVTLSTLHAAKGLEWKLVFLCGVEEDLLPHKGIQGEAQNLEEERRLAYVGITRAREQLVITHAKARVFRGKRVVRTRSRFLEDLDREYVEDIDLEAPAKEPSPAREQDFLSTLRQRLRGGAGGPPEPSP